MGTTFYGVIDSLGRKQEKKFINEGNLYRLIVKSKLLQAELAKMLNISSPYLSDILLGNRNDKKSKRKN